MGSSTCVRVRVPFVLTFTLNDKFTFFKWNEIANKMFKLNWYCMRDASGDHRRVACGNRNQNSKTEMTQTLVDILCILPSTQYPLNIIDNLQFT